MYRHDIRVEVPNELLEDMDSEGVLVSSAEKNIGVLVMSQGLEKGSSEIIIRIYSLVFYENENQYFITNELEAFSFMNYNQARQFVEHLPNMSAIEMLFFQNPIPTVQ